jgi:DnaJ-class molecular chaperone
MGKKDQATTCGTCNGSGSVQTGSNKWTGATFSKCPACRGTGSK